MVVVTIAYRLGVFGFFSHPALEDLAAGGQANFGLLDIRAAFQWVRDNIQAFGGNPDNITAFSVCVDIDQDNPVVVAVASWLLVSVAAVVLAIVRVLIDGVRTRSSRPGARQIR